jgi:hypothetical protein
MAPASANCLFLLDYHLFPPHGHIHRTAATAPLQAMPINWRHNGLRSMCPFEFSRYLA